MKINNDKKEQLIRKLKSEFIPHFDFLALEVRIDIQNVLSIICDNPNKEAIQKISR